MARASSWARLKALEDNAPVTRDPDLDVSAIIWTIIDPVSKLICGCVYKSCHGHRSEFDGLESTFDPPITEADLPEPWQTIYREEAERAERVRTKYGNRPLPSRFKRGKWIG